MIAMRRNPKGLLEHPRKVKRAEAGDLSKGYDRHRLREMFFDIVGDPLPLPGRKPPFDCLLPVDGRAIQAKEFLSENHPERFGIKRRRGIFDLALKLKRSFIESLVVEKEPRPQLEAVKAGLR